MILVTNYKRKIYAKPIDEVFESPRVDYCPTINEAVINDGLVVHVFEKVPHMRNSKNNSEWFERNIYHLK